jgi:hypothetical protein
VALTAIARLKYTRFSAVVKPSEVLRLLVTVYINSTDKNKKAPAMSPGLNFSRVDL